ncbi:MAG: hypothetical protein ABII89_07650 [Candidatus Omnitrophota bacterium]
MKNKTPEKFNSAVFSYINSPMRWIEYLKRKHGKEAYKLAFLYRVICDLSWKKGVQPQSGRPLITTYRELGGFFGISYSKVRKHLERLQNTEPSLIRFEVHEREPVKIFITFPIPKPACIPQNFPEDVPRNKSENNVTREQNNEIFDLMKKFQINSESEDVFIKDVTGKKKLPKNLTKEEAEKVIRKIKEYCSHIEGEQQSVPSIEETESVPCIGGTYKE